MAEADTEAVVDALVRDLEGSPGDTTVLARLEEAARTLIETDLVHRLEPFARRLATVDCSARPWAGLVAGAAIVSVDPERGRATLRAAYERFASQGDAEGEGYGCMLEGLVRIADGDLRAAAEWLSRSRELLGADGPLDAMAQVHLTLAAYAGGDLALAGRTAGDCRAAARARSDDRLIAVSCLYLAFVDVHRGGFVEVDAAVAEGLGALGRLAPDSRYELPALLAVQGAVAALRGDDAGAERAWDAALEESARAEHLSYEAIIRVVRADYTARLDPYRAMDDARRALDYFSWADEGWFVHWGRTALIAAHRWAGNQGTAIELARRLLTAPLNPLERGRALIAQGKALLAFDDVAATAALTEAVAGLDEIGAVYWASRADLLLAVIDPSREHEVAGRIRLRAGDRIDDPGWARLLDPQATPVPPAAATPARETTTRAVVLDLIASGFTSRQAAAALLVSPNTVETHVRAAMRLTGAATRAQAAALLLGSSPDPAPDAPVLRGDERAIVELLVAGRTIAQVAQELHFSRRTVERRLAGLRARLGVATNQALVGRGRELGVS